jgi:hypothetical protein
MGQPFLLLIKGLVQYEYPYPELNDDDGPHKRAHK